MFSGKFIQFSFVLADFRPQFDERILVKLELASFISTHDQVFLVSLKFRTAARSSLRKLYLCFLTVFTSEFQFLVSFLNDLHNLDNVLKHGFYLIDQQELSFYDWNWKKE